MRPSTVEPPPRTRETGTAGSAAVALAIPCVLLLALVALSWDPLMDLDGDIARTTHRWAVGEPDVTQTSRILTDWVWDPWTMRALCVATVLWLVVRRSAWWPALWLGGTTALGTLVQQGLKAAVGRDRPVWPDPVDSAHFSAFPSGHAMTATVVCGMLLWLLRLSGVGPVLWRMALTAAAVSVVGVGLTRVWLGVHWPTDVLGGWIFGALLVTLAVALYGRWRPMVT